MNDSKKKIKKMKKYFLIFFSNKNIRIIDKINITKGILHNKIIANKNQKKYDI